MAAFVTKIAHPYVEYDKASLRQLLSYAINRGDDNYAPECRSVRSKMYYVQTGPWEFSVKEGVNMADISESKSPLPPRKDTSQSVMRDVESIIDSPSRRIFEFEVST